MNFIALDMVVLFGGVQALSLFVFTLFRKTENKRAHRFFLLFLFCLALYNLGYAALFMNLQIGSFNMGMHPIPYKYIIAPALLGYAFSSLSAKSINTQIWILMIPSMLYGILRCYWLYAIMSEANPLIIKEAYEADFFTYNEIIILSFNFFIGIAILRKTIKSHSDRTPNFGTKKYWNWLKTLPRIFVILVGIHLLLIITSYLAVGAYDRLFYYPTLIINSLFVYWIGFMGFTKPNLLFFKPLLKDEQSAAVNPEIVSLLKTAMEVDKLFKNPKLTSQELATKLELPMHELTKYVHELSGTNISQYLNQYRTKEAIRLMASDLSKQYSLDALATEAGFSSKSSFYKVFKEQTGKTPSAYLKSLEK